MIYLFITTDILYMPIYGMVYLIITRAILYIMPLPICGPQEKHKRHEEKLVNTL